ncbi:preprotein translocase subunit SecY [Candidatus Falkowbacteria bacterium]|uniref:Protein translocase subunit SecY n=1 Tax=Candidatus Falkowbacteria bacterium CG10_big_fil_rev_8_21_14_0_10_37_18 TaxID=1974562 RepID=A0A2H0V8X0_9BACT|nr:preprotein translocase subunit SecY [Candidatus Falkowbacteria bacterium]NCQ12527.1 preprotein translocase subunit SecY [Candidatus Falkowbacteria bacterium]OIO05993.1 MAG: preprotein translocase subunit SecY [Candidatus Falkowbacteria bacterium CG1_02_37_21]PIR95513.1 MAG: preprotein translocase subunit SecY [Candidatus Falkowbacteria bacterium CG10_big_fil_rev_8_21_14_0_10_37_18]
MFSKLSQIWKIPELRNNILFVLAMLVIFRLAAHIPVPGVNAAALRNLFASNQILGLMNLFSGGGMENFSIVMMGVAPYITSSIIFQLVGMIVPSVEEMQKEESGRQKINMWTRWLTVPLGLLQSYGMITLLRKSSAGILGDISALDLGIMILVITAGSIFLMWLGELITEKKVGNGISLLIFAGIVAGLPTMLQRFIVTFDSTQVLTVLVFALITLVTVVSIVIINEGQRNIPVQYARQVRGNQSFGGTNTHLPIRVNMAGVIPIIFAISVVLFPSMIAQFLIHAKTAWIANAASSTIALFNNQLFYGIVYFILVFAFTYFYTEVIFHPTQIAENLQKQGGFIPGIRPGVNTSDYLSSTAHKIILVGALFLGVVAVLPLVMRYFTGIQSLAIGGTSLLIVVAVVIESVKEIESQLTMREYDGI